ncbi:discoidin domain-containing protein [Polaribacter sp. R77954]|uniref:discoidin domain-containing protein n=1 Tax=Polaribacter sp. R77954 TaxID=3093870 RepID=UPI0037C8A6C1
MEKCFYKILFRLQIFKSVVSKKKFYNSLKFLSSLILIFIALNANSQQHNNFILDNSAPYLINTSTLGRTFNGGDTIFVASSRTKAIKFQQLVGTASAPIVVININGQVKINNPQSWGGITFENCQYIKISGAGHPNFRYGFELGGYNCGLAFSELSSDCEAEFIKIAHDGFFGIFAKKDFGGNPPVPYPVFNNLIIHDCFIENVSEGMYIGETRSPGMEFKHLKIYNNIIRNTKRESIQIANAVEDVEIYNNTMVNAGLENLAYHTNNLQIGDNSVVNAYNNIIMQAPAFGIISFGKGNSNFSNNYIANSQGMFVDNRMFTDTLQPITISSNYFKNMNGPQVVRNMNELNPININNNIYSNNITFYNNDSGNLNNISLNNNNLSTIHQITFKDTINNNYSLSDDTPLALKGLGATSGPEFFDIIPTSHQIVIDSTMVTDQVVGGSVVSPLYLFNEQQTDVLANEHPVSTSWKPFWYWNEQTAPYHVVIDLGEEYHITEIYLHDMHDTFEFTVEYGSENNWNELFVDSCSSFKTWKTHITNVDTRYLRLSMYENVFAAVNEIIVFGYSNSIPENTNQQESTINPIIQKDAKIHPNSLGDYEVNIFDVYGKKVLSNIAKILDKKYGKAFKGTKFDKLKKGYYIALFKNKTDGSSKKIKFYKR